jgi:hypothetical protein
MKTTTNKHTLKKVAKLYVGSILAHSHGSFTEKPSSIPDNDMKYILDIIYKMGERMSGGNKKSTIGECYNMFVNSEKEMEDHTEQEKNLAAANMLYSIVHF